MNCDEIVSLAKNWILNSGIQNISSNSKINGGFNSWFDVKNKKYPFIYSEITGYGISTLIYINQIHQEKTLIERAELAAGWLIENALHNSGGIGARYLYDKKDFQNKLLYTFDSGMVLYGLTNLFKKTKKENYLKAAEQIANFLVNCQKKDGTFYAAYDSERNEFVDTQEKWSTQSGSFHCKLSLGLLDIYNITKNNSFKKSAESVCDAAIRFQDKNGRFITFKESQGTHLHPHSYSTEGLLYSGIKLNNKKFIQSAFKAYQWTLRNQLDNGGIPSVFSNDNFITYERTDILAQTLRLGVLLFILEKLDETLIDKLNSLKNRLIIFQNLNDTIKSQKGGFFYGWDGNGNKLNHLNSWCTMFALQAIDMYGNVFEKKRKIQIIPFV